MITDAVEVASDHVFDFCVIGTGPAGITLALKLESAGKTVALLEGGGEGYTRVSQDLYKGRVIGDRYVDLAAARLRFYGGTSNHWGGWCRTLDEEDFLAKKANPDTEWPIGKKDLAGYLGETAAILELPENKEDRILGASGLKEITFTYSDPVVRFAKKYRDRIRRSKTIHLFLDANVTSIETDGASVTAVNVVNQDVKPSKIKAGAYILATGGIENSRILLWSNELSEGKLIRNDRAVGKYWMEHPHFTLGGALLTGRHKFTIDSHGIVFFSPTKETMDENLILNCGLRLIPKTYKDTKKMIADVMCVAPEAGKWAAGLFGKNLICGAELYAAWEQEPRESNRIELSGEKDRLGIPRVNLFWRKSDIDLRTARKTAETLGKYFAGNNIGRVRLDDWVLGDGGYPVDEQIGGFHHMGGTRMASSPQKGVVDKNCKVHDQENLYIAGSSVFPSGGHCNPTLTIVQLAARLADHLKGEIY